MPSFFGPGITMNDIARDWNAAYVTIEIVKSLLNGGRKGQVVRHELESARQWIVHCLEYHETVRLRNDGEASEQITIERIVNAFRLVPLCANALEKVFLAGRGSREDVAKHMQGALHALDQILTDEAA